MRFEVLDAVSEPGNSARPNDDAYAHTGSFAAVVDGATGLGEPLLDEASDAAWLANRAAEALSRYSAHHVGHELLGVSLGEIEADFHRQRRRAPAARHEIPMASLMMAQPVASSRVAVTWFGDCSGVLRGADGSLQVLGGALDSRQREGSDASAAAARAGGGPAAASVRPEFLERLRAHRSRYNRSPDGPWILSPEVECARYANTAEAPVGQGSVLLLMTDGFFALVTDYARWSPEGLIEAALEHGLATLAHELREIEDADPIGLRFPRYKKSDDATALLIRVE
jgi:hypothetical protein